MSIIPVMAGNKDCQRIFTLPSIFLYSTFSNGLGKTGENASRITFVGATGHKVEIRDVFCHPSIYSYTNQRWLYK